MLWFLWRWMLDIFWMCPTPRLSASTAPLFVCFFFFTSVSHIFLPPGYFWAITPFLLSGFHLPFLWCFCLTVLPYLTVFCACWAGSSNYSGALVWASAGSKLNPVQIPLTSGAFENQPRRSSWHVPRSSSGVLIPKGLLVQELGMLSLLWLVSGTEAIIFQAQCRWTASSHLGRKPPGLQRQSRVVIRLWEPSVFIVSPSEIIKL